jgi:hypothetical protein
VPGRAIPSYQEGVGGEPESMYLICRPAGAWW